jgi:Na+/melibiose symporter-like transporter
LAGKVCSNWKESLSALEMNMIDLILGLTILNTLFILYFFLKQRETNKEILQALRDRKQESEVITEKNKEHIDDMLKMREMYESD